MQQLGAIPVDDERTTFRVWAPNARSVAVRVGDEVEQLSRDEDGTWFGDIAATNGDDYRFVVDGDAWPDPCSRFQPDGVRGPSRVVDTRRFEIAPGPELTLEELVLYELHVGTFSEVGTFDGAMP